jgi:hypothetical protein
MRPVRALAAILGLGLLANSAIAQDGEAERASERGAPRPATPASSSDTGKVGGEQRAASPEGAPAQSVCLMIEAAAAANGLPLDFFTRVIWQESRFRSDAVGPITRSGRRAQGIAQFMPGTAAERRLLDPFDPVQALPKSAEFLRELRDEFGNLGLAAAAYNAGPRRVHDWMSGRGSLPRETQNYVEKITGHSAADWATAGRNVPAAERTPARPNCRQLMALLRQSPNFFVDELARRVEHGAASPWGVQLSAGFVRAKVLATYAALEKKYRTILSGRDPMILKTKLRSRGTSDFYQVRVGADTRAAANELCRRLHAVGGACMVLRTGLGSS